MKIVNRYLNGLYQLLHYLGNPDPELGVMGLVMMFQAILLVDISIIFHFRTPLTDEIGNKWVVRLVAGSIMWLLNKYIFGIRESVYSEYAPLSKRVTLLLTILYFVTTLGFLFYHGKVSNMSW